MRRSLTWYWRAHLAVAAGAAVATAVLTGALLVGDSVRGSLRDLALDRLGSIDAAVVSERGLRQGLADDLARGLGGDARTAPALLLPGSAVHGETRARASGVDVLGIDERFAALYPDGGELDFEGAGGLFPPVYLNEALAGEIGAAPGDAVLLSIQRPSDVPRETLVGREDAAETIESLRLSVAGVVSDRGPGGFTLAPHQTRPLVALVDLDRLGRRLFGRAGGRRANLFVADLGAAAEAGAGASGTTAAERLGTALPAALTAADLGIELRRFPGRLVVESREFVIPPATAEAIGAIARERGAAVAPVSTYLANAIRSGGREVPYSTVTALEPAPAAALGRLMLADGRPAPALAEDEILINAWAAADLGLAAGPGVEDPAGAADADPIELDYYVLGARDELSTATARFRLAGVVAMEGLAVDPRLTPDFPGLQDADDIAAWNPAFPVELDRIRPRDEDYWDRYKATPKAFVALAAGRRLWRSRFGELTSLRIAPAGPKSDDGVDGLAAALEAELPRRLDPRAAGIGLRALREDGLRAASGATDFAGLFLGLSMFLIASAAMLVGLLFRLGVERRAREVGLLRAVGFPARAVRRRLLAEGAAIAAPGALLGLAGALAYAWALLAGLRSWWLPAVGAPVLFLHVEPLSLALGWASSMAVVLVAVRWALARLDRVPVPALLAGAAGADGLDRAGPAGAGARRGRRAAGVAAAGLLVAAGLEVWTLVSGRASSPALAFGAGAALLVAGLGGFAWWCGGPGLAPNALGRLAAVGMGARNSGRNRGRSLLSVGLVASACFLIVVVAANRGEGEIDVADRASGAGGFTLVAESDVPLLSDLNRHERRLELGMDDEESGALDGVTVVPFRLLPGEDVSCLNLYRPERPRILGVPPEMIARGGFTFQQAAAPVDNPWTLLEGELEPGVVPAIGDYNSVLWILHSGLGKDLAVVDESGAELRLRFVGLLSRSLFQSEVLISEENFVRHFPSRSGYSFFLADPPPERAAGVAAALETGLDRFGLDATGSGERIAAFRAVESTYLSTFQTLGGLGLVLGTVGLGIVLLRNVLERRAELATLQAFGFRRRTLAGMVLAENGALLAAGVAIGALSGLVASAPHVVAGGHGFPWPSLAATLAAVLAAGMLSSVAAVAGTLRAPLLGALRSE